MKNENLIQHDKYLIGEFYSGNTTTLCYLYIALNNTDSIRIEWGDGSYNNYTVTGTGSQYTTTYSYTHSYSNSGIYKVRLIYDNTNNVIGLGLSNVYSISKNYKRFPNLKNLTYTNTYYQLKNKEYIDLYNLKRIYLYQVNVLVDYDSIPNDIEYLTYTREYYSDIKQSCNITSKFSKLKNLKILNLTNHTLINLDASVLSGNTGMTTLSFSQTSSKIFGDISWVKYNRITSLNTTFSNVSYNLNNFIFSPKIQTLILSKNAVWNIYDCLSSFDLTYSSNVLYAYELNMLSGSTEDVNSITGTTFNFYMFSIFTKYLYGDITNLNRIKSNFRWEIHCENLYGDISTLNQSHIKPSSVFSLCNGTFYGDCSFLSGITASTIYMYSIQKDDIQSLTNVEQIVNNNNRTLLWLYDNNFTTAQLNSIINMVFSKRTDYNTASKTLYIYSNSGTPTGTYQQPDLGTYTGNINNLTETQINNLVAGTDYTGIGTNITWSELEKCWVLVNLDISSTNSTARYKWLITY
jgi:hypothetical protein